eukprot:TRINITY_DN10212_c0_g1_i2.p1 TRINITY_DN10212_c0_g1~~TRINITY_DN10212_c0_g1_i2.p1  ORF type:complete len:116 (-),score=11.23 TRINITY_DN10212_c0_g1_i2:4-300(-)
MAVASQLCAVPAVNRYQEFMLQDDRHLDNPFLADLDIVDYVALKLMLGLKLDESLCKADGSFKGGDLYWDLTDHPDVKCCAAPRSNDDIAAQVRNVPI